MASILITRPRQDATSLAELLHPQGHEVLIAPMLEIYFFDVQAELKLALDAFPQAILITSANGVRALARLTNERDIALVTVGDASAEEAKRRGFTKISSSDGDLSHMVEWIRTHLDPQKGSLLHIAGSVVAGDVQNMLEPLGFKVNRLVCYDAKPLKTLPKTVKDALTQGEIDTVLFYSPRSGRIYVECLQREDINHSVKSMCALCLSPNVAEEIADLPWKEIVIAESPTQDALLALIK